MDARASSSEEIDQLVDVLEQATNDFVGADLRFATLHDASLDGIRWSDRTSWPAEWDEHIRAASVEIEPGLYRITGWRYRAHSPATS